MALKDSVKIGEVCDIINGYAFKSSNYVESGIRIIRITNVQKGFVHDNDPKYYPSDTIKAIKPFLLDEGDLLISLTGNVGRVGILEKEMLPAALNQRVACIRIKNENQVEKKYLFHILNSNTFENECLFNAKGIAQKNMSTEWLKNYCIKLPSVDIQRNISYKIDKIDELIMNSRKQLFDLDLLIKSRYCKRMSEEVAA